MINMYDEANIDLEEMMYLHDVENEDDTEDTSNENEDDISNEVEDDYVLTQSFLDRQSKLLDNEKIKMKVFINHPKKYLKVLYWENVKVLLINMYFLCMK